MTHKQLTDNTDEDASICNGRVVYTVTPLTSKQLQEVLSKSKPNDNEMVNNIWGPRDHYKVHKVIDGALHKEDVFISNINPDQNAAPVETDWLKQQLGKQHSEFVKQVDVLQQQNVNQMNPFDVQSYKDAVYLQSTVKKKRIDWSKPLRIKYYVGARLNAMNVVKVENVVINDTKVVFVTALDTINTERDYVFTLDGNCIKELSHELANRDTYIENAPEEITYLVAVFKDRDGNITTKVVQNTHQEIVAVSGLPGFIKFMIEKIKSTNE